MSIAAESYLVHAGGVSSLKYDATDAKGRRASAKIYSGSEDVVLDTAKRAKLLANSRDLRRNFTIAAWMIRKHLDYVATFDFHCRSGNGPVDDQVEKLMRGWSRRENFDSRGRHRLSKLVRLAEAMRVVDGDFGLLKIASGTVQGIESDRIKNPTGDSGKQDWVHGVKLGSSGQALAYAVHRRTASGSLEFERNIPAANLILHGNFERYDQVRGISPLAPGLNALRDTYENFDYALARAKVSQLFALALYRNADDGPAEAREDKSFDFGRGPQFLDLQIDEKAEFLESKTPSTEFQAFTLAVIQVALKALDLPYSFYDESHTNFFGSRGAFLHYERACRDKREDLVEVLSELTEWRLLLWVLDGSLKLPRGMTIGDLNFEWVPAGMPWWDPAKEIRGDLMAISAGLDNPQRIVKERGRGDFYQNVDLTAEAIAYARSKGMTVSFDAGPDPQTVEVASAD